MKGFDPQFTDLPDYILKCTAQIWEGRDIAALDWHYGENLIVRTPAGINQGNVAGKANTMATLTEFPDRQLLGEDVIWFGDDQSGFLSSHRTVSTATHNGGSFGPATECQTVFRTIADTLCFENRALDEWLIRDNGAIVTQLGQTFKTTAQAQIYSGDLALPLTPNSDVIGPYTGAGNDNEWGQKHAEILKQVMNAEFAIIDRSYDRACHLALPCGVEVHGTSAAKEFFIGLRSAFPLAIFKIQHQIGRCEPMYSPRSSIRWSLTGKHEGYGRYGAPTGAEVHVMGVSHAKFGPWGLRRETTLIDDIAIWKQILL
jgi:hypothetical protein